MMKALDISHMNLIGLNIGCGRYFEHNYTDIDFLYVDIEDVEGDLVTELSGARLLRTTGGFYYLQCDLAQGLPIKACCIEAVFLEHVVEHLPLATAVGLLRSAYGALEVGGTLRVSVPDLAIYASAYVNRDHDFFKNHAEAIAEAAACTWHEVIGALPGDAEPFLPSALEADRVAAFLSRPAAAVNQIFQFWGHHWIYDFDELKALLAAAGFDGQAVSKGAYRTGRNSRLASLDRAFRRDESLYVEAVK